MDRSRHFRTLSTALIVLLLPALSNAAANVALDNIFMSKMNGVATVQIRPACKIRYIDHTPSEAGTELRIEASTGEDCSELLSEVSREVYLPVGRRLGKVDEVVFDTIGDTNSYITLRFSTPQKFQVRQHPTGWIEIFVDTNIDSASLPANVPPPLDEPPAAVVVPPPVFVERRAAPAPVPERTARMHVAPSSTGQFVIQLGVFESVDLAVAELLRADTPHFAYTTEFTVNDRTWQGLQLGFFESEAAAGIVLADLQTTFPDSWVRYVEPAEADHALAQGELRASRPGKVPAVRVSRDASASQNEIPALMAGGRQAILDRRYTDAIASYSRVLEYPDHDYRAQAREYLGVAHERNGQRANAVAEYQAFLQEFPGDEGIARVAGRLNALESAGMQTAGMSVPPRQSEADSWQVYGGISQYYWRNQEQLVHDGNAIVNGSGVLALGDFTASRRGERFDILARVNGAYQFNLVEFDDTGDIGWVSDAYLDVTDQRLGVQGKVGRQTLHSDGVLGRFDGAAFNYQWKQDISFSLSGGFPVDSPRYITGSQRTFYAAGAHVDDLWDKFNVSAYTHQQTVDGISDRQALGGEVHYREGPLSVIGLLDYDASYNILNAALVNGSFRLQNGWRLHGMVDFGAQPYITTRNALAGQTATSIDELLETYSEGQVRTLARDRTAQATTASIGLAIPFWERFEVSMDVTSRQSDGTVASGGVAAMPATGSQMFYNTTLVASNLMRRGDLTILTLRHDSTLTRDSSMIMFDTRLPFGESLRINPRVSLMQRTVTDTGMDQLVATPALRVIYRWRSMMFDLEAGGRWSTRELPPDEFDPFTVDGTEELTGYFLNLGYRLEF